MKTSQNYAENTNWDDFASLGLLRKVLGFLRSVSWAAQKKLKTLENVMLELPDRSGRTAALLGPRREALGAESHPRPGMMAARIGMT